MLRKLFARISLPLRRSQLSEQASRIKPVSFGELRRLTPVSTVFGFDRGKPIDRYYIEKFLSLHQPDIHGRVLEIGEPLYTSTFGSNRVTHSEVLHAVPGNDQATLVGDLATGEGMPRNAFDCVILTQTLLCIYDVKSAVENVYAALRPGGAVLATFPGISQISRYDRDRWGDYWRFTTMSARRLFEEFFCAKDVIVQAHGNVFVAVAFLHGLATEELTPEELEFHDPDYQVVITVRAVKS